ncbi:MAG: type II secretion system F family protein [Syntrophomonadaceae bacterium]
MELIISALTFLAIAGVIIGLNRINTLEQTILDRRMDNIAKEFKGDPDEQGRKSKELSVSNLLAAIGKSFSSFSFSKKLELELSKADMFWRVEEFIGLNIVTALLGGALGYLIFGLTAPTFVFVLLGIIMPGFIIYWNKQKRAALLNEQVGESLTGMSNSLRAGYSFQQAMDLVSKESTGPLATEYRRTLREINLGITTEQALQNLIERANNDDMELMISAVLIQRSIGGNLAEVFDKIAETIRQRIRVKGEVKTLTAQGRISGLIIGLMPVVMIALLLLVDPKYINVLLTNKTGWFLLGGAAISEMIGFYLIKRITDIEF